MNNSSLFRAGITPTYADSHYLGLDQTTPQHVTGGRPKLDAGFEWLGTAGSTGGNMFLDGTQANGDGIFVIGPESLLPTAQYFETRFYSSSWFDKASIPYYGTNFAAFGSNDSFGALMVIMSGFNMTDTSPAGRGTVYATGLASTEIGVSANPFFLQTNGTYIGVGGATQLALNSLDVCGNTTYGGGICVGSTYAGMQAAPINGILSEGDITTAAYLNALYINCGSINADSASETYIGNNIGGTYIGNWFFNGVDGITDATGLITTGTIKSGTYKSSDGSSGISTTVTTASLVGKTLTIKNGLITAFA